MPNNAGVSVAEEVGQVTEDAIVISSVNTLTNGIVNVNSNVITFQYMANVVVVDSEIPAQTDADLAQVVLTLINIIHNAYKTRK